MGRVGEIGGGAGQGQRGDHKQEREKTGKMGGVEHGEGRHNDDAITFMRNRHDRRHQLKNNNQLTVAGDARVGVSVVDKGRRGRQRGTGERD